MLLSDSPNRHCENLVRIGLIEIDESRLSFYLDCKMGGRNRPANRLLLSDIFGSILRGDGFLGIGDENEPD